MGLCPSKQDRVAVRTGTSDLGGAERRASATDVFNHEGAEQRLHLVRPGATDGVEGTARRKGNHEPDRPCRIGLRAHHMWEGRQRGNARDKMQKLATEKFHKLSSRSSRNVRLDASQSVTDG